MAQSRLTTALTDGDLTLPDGRVTLMRPPIGYDLSAIMDRDVAIQHGFKPDCAYWETAGYDVTPDLTASAAVIVVVPRSKPLARAMIVKASQNAPIVIVDGQRTDGVDSLFKDVKKSAGPTQSVAKAHGRLFWFASDDLPSDWTASQMTTGPDGYLTQPGVFSESGPDKGSMALLAALPTKLPASVCDLGGGWGYLTAEILKAYPDVAQMDLIEAEALSVACAERNITDDRGRIVWADALTWQPDQKYQAVICNPPFHTTRRADPSIGQQFIAAAARMLAPNGALWLVANRHLPYESSLADHFVRVDEIVGTGAFKVFHAQRPKKP